MLAEIFNEDFHLLVSDTSDEKEFVSCFVTKNLDAKVFLGHLAPQARKKLREILEGIERSYR